MTAVRAAGRSAGGAMSAGVGMSGGGLETGPAGWIVVSSVDGSWHVLDASTGDEKLSITADAGDETMRRSNESGLDGGLDMTVPLHTPPLAATGDGFTRCDLRRPHRHWKEHKRRGVKSTGRLQRDDASGSSIDNRLYS